MKKLNVLYVEDNEMLQSLMEFALMSSNIFRALTGEAAVEILDSHPTFDLIMLDIGLGEGMDGIELCKIIRSREEYKSTPIVAITAYDYSKIGEHIHSDMFTTCFPKPFKIAEIVRFQDQCLSVKSDRI